MHAAGSAAFDATRARAQRNVRGAPMFFRFEQDKEVEDEIRIHLADVPRAQQSLEVDGFKPSLLSRLLDIISPLGKR